MRRGEERGAGAAAAPGELRNLNCLLRTDSKFRSGPAAAGVLAQEELREPGDEDGPVAGVHPSESEGEEAEDTEDEGEEEGEGEEEEQNEEEGENMEAEERQMGHGSNSRLKRLSQTT